MNWMEAMKDRGCAVVPKSEMDKNMFEPQTTKMTCEKCGGHSITAKWYPDKAHRDTYTWAQDPDGEHIRYTCAYCHYEWTGPCTDQIKTTPRPQGHDHSGWTPGDLRRMAEVLHYGHVIVQKDATISRLCEALKPFADFGSWSLSERPDFPIYAKSTTETGSPVSICFGDVQRAHNTMKSL